jgi:hypothetical protein
MSRTLSGNNRAIMGLRTAVLVGLAGSAITAALLISTDPTAPVDGTAGHNQQVTAPSPVPIPDAARHAHSDSAVMLPRYDVLTYSAMSDSWSKRSVRDQSKICSAWNAGSNADRSTIVSNVIRNAATLDKAWMQPETVAQFFGDVCNDQR